MKTIEGRNIMVPIRFYTEPKIRGAMEQSMCDTVKHETGQDVSHLRWEFLAWHDFEENDPLEGEYVHADKENAEVARLCVEAVVDVD